MLNRRPLRLHSRHQTLRLRMRTGPGASDCTTLADAPLVHPKFLNDLCIEVAGPAWS